MKRKQPKLILSRESLRMMTTPDLDRVAGGFSGPPSFICNSGCLPHTCATACPTCA